MHILLNIVFQYLAVRNNLLIFAAKYDDMKKILILLCIMSMFLGCCKKAAQTPGHRLIEEIVVDFDNDDDEYRKYGYYRKVFRKYNYEYYDSTWYDMKIDSFRRACCYVNEFGDTTFILYVDYTNYPRREE